MKKVFSGSSFLSSPMAAISNAGTLVMFAAAILLPLVLLPFGENFLVDSKMLLLFLIAVVVFFVWVVTTFTKKTLQITLSPFLLPLVLLLVSVLISSFYRQVIPMNQLLGFGGVYLSFIVIAVFGPSILPKNAHKLFLPILYIPAILLAFTELAEVAGFGPSKIINTILPFGFPTSPLFSLAGSPLIAAEFLAMVFGATIIGLASKQTAKRQKPFLLLVLAAAVVGMVINVRTVLQQNTSPFMTPFNVSWSITTDMLKSFPSTILGVGPDNFSQAYLILKPAFINITPAWNITYTQASDLFLSVFITLGVVGLAAWGWLAFQVVKRFRVTSAEAKPIAALVIVALVIELLLPPNALVLGMQALALAFWIVAEKKNLKSIQMHAFTVQITESDTEVQKIPKNSHFLIYITTALSALLIALTVWGLGRYLLAEYYSFLAILGTAQNNAVTVYTNQQKAIQAYPYSATFRRNYSNTNMVIALNLSARTNLSDQDKQQALALVQQSIDQAKAATTIQPNYSLNWVNLARIYTNLIGTADGADSWAISAYSQAITTAPTDPILHLEAGGLLYRLNQPQQAVQIFEQTVSLKPDWPNAYYNLANAYKLNKESDKAIAAYQQAITLLASNPDQQKQVQAELDQFQKELTRAKTKAPVVTPPAQSTATSSALLSPTATTTPAVSPEAKNALKNVNLNQGQ